MLFFDTEAIRISVVFENQLFQVEERAFVLHVLPHLCAQGM